MCSLSPCLPRVHPSIRAEMYSRRSGGFPSRSLPGADEETRAAPSSPERLVFPASPALWRALSNRSTHRRQCRPSSIPSSSHVLQLRQRDRPFFLHIAELRKNVQVILVRPFPCKIVRFAPDPRVVRRTWVGKQRYRLVGPDAVINQPPAPGFNSSGIIDVAFD